MTNTRDIITTALCLLLGFSPLQAQETAEATAPQPVQQAPAPKIEHPFFQGGFYPSWSKMSAKAGLIDVVTAIDIARKDLAKIAEVEPGQETWDNVFQALENAGQELDDVSSMLGHLFQVKDNEALRKAQQTLIPILGEFSGELVKNDKLWQVIKRAAAQPWVKELSPAKQRMVQQIVDTFREGGVDLPDDKKGRKLEIMTEMAQLQMKYDQNVMDATYAWHLVITDPAQLAGMPEEWMKQTAVLAQSQGCGTPENPQWYITLDAASAGAIMKQCTVSETRKTCWEGLLACGRGTEHDNAPIVARIMELRQELAELLGYKNYADMTCQHRMVDTGDKALAFVDDMMSKILPAFQKENQELLDYISAQKGGKQEAVIPWDRRFYEIRLAQEQCDFNKEALRPYLRSDNVLKGIFGVYSKLYDISISEEPTAYVRKGMPCPTGKVEVWAKDVKVFKVTDNKTGAHLGSFYFDPYPRAGKHDGAWAAPLRVGKPGKDGQPHEPHLAVLAANLSRPGKEGYSLYSQTDVETIFHEFGHIMHAMLSDTEVHSHGGTETALDFVELPSQMNEYWAWEPEVIATYAFHYQTGEPIPAELVQKLISTRYYRPATEAMEQLCLAKLDLELHMHYAEKFAGKSLDDATAELLTPWQLPMTEQSPSILRNFSHCVSEGYAAGYFSYKWAEVLCADAFTRFEKEGILNPETGAAYRNAILKQGDSKPADQLYRDFMGRDPNPDALLEKQGLKQQ